VDVYLVLDRPMDTSDAEMQRLWHCAGWQQGRRDYPDQYPYPFHHGRIPWVSRFQDRVRGFIDVQVRPADTVCAGQPSDTYRWLDRG
jgi:hypothetical protein